MFVLPGFTVTCVRRRQVPSTCAKLYPPGMADVKPQDGSRYRLVIGSGQASKL